MASVRLHMAICKATDGYLYKNYGFNITTAAATTTAAPTTATTVVATAVLPLVYHYQCCILAVPLLHNGSTTAAAWQYHCYVLAVPLLHPDSTTATSLPLLHPGSKQHCKAAHVTGSVQAKSTLLSLNARNRRHNITTHSTL